ncbi:putative TRAP transporter small permease protein [Mesorhizobium sp. L-8-10]|nr:putative TRAP transporter small permease protein [Mesorhizobium sp. L-8-10]
MRQFRRIFDAGWKVLDAVMALMMLAMIGVVFANVVLRYGFSSAMASSVEVSRFLFVWIVMLGAVACLRHGEHLQLTSVVEAMPPRLQRLMIVLIQVVIVVFCAMLFLGSMRQTFANWANIQPMSGLPVGTVYLAGAVGGALMAVIAAIRVFSGRSGYETDEVGEERQ